MVDPATPQVASAVNVAIDMIDQTEPMIRDMIEGDLMDVAGINRTKVGDAMLAADALSKKITVVRTRAIKQAFRYLRDTLNGL